MKKELMLYLALVVSTIGTAQAQQPPVKGGTVIASTPGKAAMVSAAEITATVVGIDKATRTVSLKGPKGRVVDVAVSDEVKNFDQIHVGDNVVVKYMEALTLELKKTKGKPDAKSEMAMVRAEPGAKPAAAAGHEITILADVVEVDPKKSTISLKGPQGNVVVLKVENPDHFKVVKVGDQVEAVYTQAVAVAVTTAAPKAAPAAKAHKK